MLPTVEEGRGYDFQDPENAKKWRGLFVSSLRKVLEQVHPSLNAEESALEYVESLCFRLIGALCSPPTPRCVQDVEERVARTFPTPIDKWALRDARDAAAARRRRSLLPHDRLHQLLQKEILMYKIDTSVSVFMTAILEYVSADILKLAGNFVKKISQKSGYETITCSDIKTAMCADKVLLDMFYQESLSPAPPSRHAHTSLSYAELARDLVTDEKHFLRDLHLVIRVFKGELADMLDRSAQDQISLIFGNIVDIYELTVTLLGNLEDAMEMSQDSQTPYIGSCFEELAEQEEFRAYVRYTNAVTTKESRQALQNIVDDPAFSERLDTAGHGFRLAVKYYLPKLLLAPVAHVFLYHSYVLALLQVAPATDDRESFKQVECHLDFIIKNLLSKALSNGPKISDMALRMAARTRRQLAIDKCNELARAIDHWEHRDARQCCNELIREDTVTKIGPGKRMAERRAFLFDGVLLLCKPVTSIINNTILEPRLSKGTVGTGTGPTGSGNTQQFKMKEKLYVRKLELIDRPDSEEARHSVELVPRVGAPVILACATSRDKRDWLADLVMLNTKPMLDRTLDSILFDLEKRHPLKLPPPSLYRFAVPDSPDNIRLEEKLPNAPAPLIKGATLLKLVERLTYHVHADLNLVRTFLTTYRSFCSPSELLALLIERFNIPEPSEVYEPESIESVASDAEKLSKNTAREDWKRYRKEFQQPVKFRVINVLRHWVDQHFYDFEREPALLEKLTAFLESVDGRPMKKWVHSVLKTVQRKCGQSEGEGSGVSHVFCHPPPPLLPHPAPPALHNFHPLALHPVELARQLTLIEFQLYRQVKPSELVGAVWTKKDKEKTSPNLLKIIKHTTNFTRWMEKWIVESANLEERVGVMCRFLELGIALQELNNFNGVLCVAAAAGSASVHRLRATKQLIPPRLQRHLDEFRELNSDHFRRYQEKLRSINPPCVPFFGMYLTNILHIEEGNRDFLPDSDNKLINFSKRRKVAEITGEIQQYQNQPYCLTVEPKLKTFLEELDPFPNMDENDITNYLYARSLEIEPRPPLKQMPKFPRKYPELLNLKPVKVSRRALTSQNQGDSYTNNDDTHSVSQLSPTSGSSSTWDGASVSSLSLSEHRGSKHEEGRGSLISPRLDRSSSNAFSQLSLFDKGLALFDKAKNSRSEEPPSPRTIERHSPRHERTPVYAPERKPALSPRGPLAEAVVHSEERVPPLLPRSTNAHSPKTKPEVHTPVPAAVGEPRAPPSPLPARDRRVPTMSPKRDPAPAPPGPAPPPPTAFSFPAAGTPPATQQSCACGTPPPLPPRRPRDPAPPTPELQPAAALPPPAPPSPQPPPLPPRPAPAPALLHTAHSAILQRRHTNKTSTAPRLPPKPPAPPARP